jgi:soluble lytic murein transglycosylase-like protein
MPRVLLAFAVALLVAAPAAHASVPHTVIGGETLSGIAAANGMSTATLAAANGISAETLVVEGTTVQIPPAAAAAAPAVATPSAAPQPLGGYTVRWGDTLSGLAATARVPVGAIAQMNGLDPTAVLLAGTVLKLPTGAPVPAGAAQPAPATRVAAAAPAPTPGRVTAGDIATVAGRNGVPAGLASAIAWQESGFNNAMVSSANARGVMQVMPGTWTWVQGNLARRQLDPNVPIDNVGAGVLYLGHLLRQTGGDEATAAAAYYQGLSSVRRIGMLPETRQYVSNVLALKGRFGG